MFNYAIAIFNGCWGGVVQRKTKFIFILGLRFF